jgi:hypothetical protein
MNKESVMKHLLGSYLCLLLMSPVLAMADASQQVLAIAANVHTGMLVCEKRQTIMLWPDTALPGRFILKMNKTVFRMKPVPSDSGAVRLEDEKTGAIWIQTDEKSMLLDSLRSKRLADDCQSPVQKTAAQQFPASAHLDLLEASSNNR